MESRLCGLNIAVRRTTLQRFVSDHLRPLYRVTGEMLQMNRLHDLAQLVISCWRLSTDDRLIPTSNGVLDLALKRAVDEGAFPGWARKAMHFVDSRSGWECVELTEILKWAQQAQLTTAPNPSYQTAEVQVSERVAQTLLRRLGVSNEDASRWGTALKDALVEAKQQSKSDAAAIVAY
jgi:hypothetical protein